MIHYFFYKKIMQSTLLNSSWRIHQMCLWARELEWGGKDFYLRGFYRLSVACRQINWGYVGGLIQNRTLVAISKNFLQKKSGRFSLEAHMRRCWRRFAQLLINIGYVINMADSLNWKSRGVEGNWVIIKKNWRRNINIVIRCPKRIGFQL